MFSHLKDRSVLNASVGCCFHCCRPVTQHPHANTPLHIITQFKHSVPKHYLGHHNRINDNVPLTKKASFWHENIPILRVCSCRPRFQVVNTSVLRMRHSASLLCCSLASFFTSLHRVKTADYKPFFPACF